MIGGRGGRTAELIARKYRRRRRTPVVAILTTAVVLLTVGVAAGVTLRSAAVRHQLSLSFVRQPDNFAALYFQAPRQLPTTFVPGVQFRLVVGITNHSIESHPFELRWAAERTRGGDLELGSRTVSVAGGSAKNITVGVALPRSATAITITMTPSGETIRARLAAVS